MVVNYGKNEFRLKNIIGQFAVFIALKKVFENNWFGEKNVHMQKNKKKKERKKFYLLLFSLIGRFTLQ